MDAPVAHDLYEFEDLCLDRRSGGLFRRDAAGGLTPVPIGARALDVLGVLVSRSGELLSKQAIMEIVWPRILVDEKNLAVQIATLRRVLDNGRADRSCIQTEAGRGYRFVAPVMRVSRNDKTDAPAASRSAASPVPVAETPGASATAAMPGFGFTRWTWAALGALAMLVLAVGLGGVWLAAGRPKPVIDAAESSRRLSATPPLSAPRLSLVVLPFQNLSGDAKDDYLADAITDDLTSDLSSISVAFVIARQTAYTYRGKPTDVRRIGEELGVRYVLEGSVRRMGAMLRVMCSSPRPRPVPIYDPIASTRTSASLPPGRSRS